MDATLPTVPRTLLPEDSLALLIERQGSTARPATSAAAQATPPAQRSGPEVEVPYKPTIVAATDGACKGNPGPGGWAWYIDTESWASGGDKHTTNNIMEVMAIREILRATQDRSDQPLHLKVDSNYAISALTKWIHGWKRNGWKNGKGQAVANRELIEETATLLQGRDVRFEWVRGHDGNALNEAADTRASAAAIAARSGTVATYGPGFTG